MRTAFVALVSFLVSAPARAEPPRAFVFDVVVSPGVDAFAQESVDAARAELERARLLELNGAEARVHGRDAEALRKVERARALFTEAVRAYDNLELDDAITKLGRVVADLDAGWVALEDPGVLVDALLRLGAALVLDGRGRDAEGPFARVHALAPERQPDPEFFPEQVTSRFQQVVARLGRAGFGSIEVRATPSEALVYVDGRFRGRSPETVQDLAPGTHLVRVRAPGYLDQAASVMVRAARAEPVNVRLAVAPGAPGLPGLVAGLAGRGAGTVDRIGELLGLRVVVVLRFASGEGGVVEVEGLRYDLSSAAPPLRRSASVSADPEGVEGVVRLAVALVRERGRPSGRSPRTDPGQLVVPPEEPGITSRWWFWTGVAVVVLGGVAVGVVLAAGGSEPAERPPGELVLRF
jgi:hypothetical protein